MTFLFDGAQLCVYFFFPHFFSLFSFYIFNHQPFWLFVFIAPRIAVLTQPCAASLFHADDEGWVDRSKARWKEMRHRRKVTRDAAVTAAAAAAIVAAQAVSLPATPVNATAAVDDAAAAPNRRSSHLASSGALGSRHNKGGGCGGVVHTKQLYTKQLFKNMQVHRR